MILLLDNYDSFTCNLYDYICQAGEKCLVVRNDEYTIEEIATLQFDKIVISPGPETPSKAGITNQLIARYEKEKPILGICIGHQAIGEFYGADLVKGIKPMHGKTSKISIASHFLFDEIENPMEVMRYHSLVLQNVQSPLQIIAETDEKEIMAIQHQDLPICGVQFHPESILTTQGLQLIKNWIENT